MKSAISSALTRFSMFSLTFCSCPDKVCMTNHWLFGIRLSLNDESNDGGNQQIHPHGEKAQQSHRYNHDHGGALQLFPSRPGAFLQLFHRLVPVRGQAKEG